MKFVNLKNDGTPKIRTLVYSVNGDVKESDIESLNSIIEKNLDVNLSLILYTGDITENAKSLILDNRLGIEGDNKILLIHSNPNTSKIMISMEKALRKGYDFDSESLIKESKSIIENDLNFNNEIKHWLDYQLENGLIIEQIKTSNNFKKLADCLKLYLYSINEPSSPKEIFAKNLENNLKYRIYNQKGKNGVISSDFESDTIITELSNELYDNNF